MPVLKPVNNIAGASLHKNPRALPGVARRSMARNAALGLDNFSSLLHGESITAAPGTTVPASLKTTGTAQQNLIGRNGQPASLRKLGSHIFEEAPVEFAAPPPEKTRLARPAGSEGSILALRAAGHKLKNVTEMVLGTLSSLFESGREGISAIGYDRVGGTSYGKYQIASRTGTLDEFIAFLDKKSPELGKLLKEAGPGNTGGKEGRMPEVWQGIAAREPERFADLQHSFIHERLYLPAANKLKGYGLDVDKFSSTMREVLFSTAVQHGPSAAARLVIRAAGEAGGSTPTGAAWGETARPPTDEAELIRRIYNARRTQFGSSTPQVRESVSERLQSEMRLALNLLQNQRG
ncbi:MAG: hypothetical protein FWG17_03875 [Desulfovibrionaceae bacterium]|nr:hypothetical protein [Desulfovibrionaceae bacterium]